MTILLFQEIICVYAYSLMRFIAMHALNKDGGIGGFLLTLIDGEGLNKRKGAEKIL